ncbi:MAG: hypothetical protein SH857_15680 [Chitinophagales bacterium]|nr:hypothetical protein [Chitinophagales bacterium]
MLINSINDVIENINSVEQGRFYIRLIVGIAYKDQYHLIANTVTLTLLNRLSKVDSIKT